uniref:VPS37 C-terminal domain-containing protein n=1 Tax=Monodelphis domestica TaxID=13616 RepID=F6TEX3_MONDO
NPGPPLSRRAAGRPCVRAEVSRLCPSLAFVPGFLILLLLSRKALSSSLAPQEQMEQLLLGEQSLEAFLPAFQRGRALAHLRRTQAEKLQELLLKQERPQPPTPPPPPPPPPTAAPTKLFQGLPAAPRNLPPLDSRPAPPLVQGSPLRLLGQASLLSPRPPQSEPPHR